MKKLISLMLAVCMCLSAGVMLTSCGHECTFKTEWTTDATHHWHVCEDAECTEVSDKAEHTWNEGVITTEATATADGVKTYTCTVCSQTKTEKVEYVAVTTVTAEEWKNAFSLDTFSNVTVDAVTSQGSSWTATTHAKVCVDGSYLHTTENGADDSNQYCQIKDGIYYSFSVDDNGTWHRSTTQSYQGIDKDQFANYFLIDFSNDYEGFSYDETLKGYVDTEYLWNGYTFNATVYFIDGKVTGIVMKSDYTDMTINYSGYGTTVISYPDVAA